ncbi:MAG: hypothetical protein ACUVSL_17710 [Chloroflexus sp.]|uniref:hypothetical protein n=1 Tax=Chloroflexus sp. TaxID=1904827 RepID=UPI00404A2965
MDRFLPELMLKGEAVHWGRIPVSFPFSLSVRFSESVILDYLLLDHEDNADNTFIQQHLRLLIDIELVGIIEVIRIFETALVNLSGFQAFSDVVPSVFDRELLLAWCAVGKLFLRGVSR